MPKAKTQTTAEAVEENLQSSPALPLQYDVRIQSLRMNGNTRGTASVNLNGQFAVRNISIVEGKNGLFVSMPSNKLESGEYIDICFPCTKDAKAEFDSAVLSAFRHAQTQGANEQRQAPATDLMPLKYDVKISSLSLGEGARRGSASVNLNDQFAIRRVSIMEGSNGLFVSLPSFKGGNGEYKDHCFPCTKESRVEFDKAVLDAYRQALTQNQEEGQQREAPDPFAEKTQESTMAMQM